MNLPHPIFHSFYDTVVKSISVATATIREKSMFKAAIEEKRLNEENEQNDGLTVSSSWRKRGFSIWNCYVNWLAYRKNIRCNS